MLERSPDTESCSADIEEFRALEQTEANPFFLVRDRHDRFLKKRETMPISPATKKPAICVIDSEEMSRE